MKLDPKTIIDIDQDAGLNRRPSTTVISNTYFELNIPKYHYKRDKPDSRDYIYKLSTSPQPGKVDLRIYCSRVEDQGNLGSCTGNAIAGAIELLNKRGGKQNDVSRLFIYYYERVLINTVNYDSGAYIRDGIKVTNKQGAPLETLWPYDITKYKSKPIATAIKDASRRKVSLYQRITNHTGCLDALANGYPVVIGFDVYDSFESGNWWYTTGIMPYPDTINETLLGGHAVLLVGYDKSNQRYIARNSWGTGWGDKGYFYMPFRVIQNSSMSEDFWIIKSVNNP